MINSIEIKNYLSHKNTKLEFSPGLNIIVGETDSGKSGIISSFGWVIDNRPLGDSYRSKWGGDTDVQIFLDNCSVRKLKTDNKHIYFLNKQQFKAFKTSVPEEIKAALNLSPINLQTQFESHFLISSNPGEVSQYFNKIANLDKIDTGLQNVNSWIRSQESEIKSDNRQKEIEELNLLKFDYLDEFEDRLQKLENIEGKLLDNGKLQKNLSNIITNLNTYEELIEDKQEDLKIEEPVYFILNEYDKLDKVDEEISSLQTIINKISFIDKQLILSNELKEFDIYVDKLLNSYSRLEKADEEIIDLKRLIESYNKTISQIESKENQISEDEIILHENIGGECPFCGTKIS